MTKAKPAISFEFFPPKTVKGRDQLLQETTPALNELAPEFFSITYGAGGTTRETTSGLVSTIRNTGIDVAPHLSFGGDDEDTIGALLDAYREQGINRLVALRGDLPSGMGGPGQLVYANELVEFIRSRTGDHFQIHVAAYPEIHPEALSYDSDLHYLKGKLDAGADSAITQYFFNVEAYFYFLDQCAAIGIDKPIYAGIMPIINFTNLARFSSNCGAEIPRWICQRAEAYGQDQDSLRKFGIEVVTQLCQTLLDSGAPGIHFYTMNQVEPTREICTNLGSIASSPVMHAHTRIYTEQALQPNASIQLEPGPSQHIARSLRMRVDDSLILFDGRGGQYPASVTSIDKKCVTATTGDFDPLELESRLQLHLGIAISRGERMDWLVQKATELGVRSIAPLFSERTEVKLKAERATKKLEHWQQVIIGACEQCGRNQLPRIEPLQALGHWLTAVRADTRLVLHHRAAHGSAGDAAPGSVALLVGPEGGLTPAEIEAAEGAGFIAMQLGPRVLRTETAPLAAIAILQARWGDMAGH